MDSVSATAPSSRGGGSAGAGSGAAGDGSAAAGGAIGCAGGAGGSAASEGAPSCGAAARGLDGALPPEQASERTGARRSASTPAAATDARLPDIGMRMMIGHSAWWVTPAPGTVPASASSSISGRHDTTRLRPSSLAR